MDLKDLAGFGKATEKLIDTVSNGLGEVGNAIFHLDAKKIRRIGKAQADADRQRIISHAETESWVKASEDVMLRAQKRFLLQQYNKQVNLENIIYKAGKSLGRTSVSEEPVEKDWATTFLNVAQEISDEEIQEILAQVLAGEIQLPGRYSKKLLHILSSMTKGDLQDFEKLVALYIEGVGIFSDNQKSHEFYSKFGSSLSALLNLVDAGLINGNTELSLIVNLTLDDNELDMNVAGKKHVYYRSQGLPYKIDIPVVKFTHVGIELANILLKVKTISPNPEYIELIKVWMEARGVEAKQ